MIAIIIYGKILTESSFKDKKLLKKAILFLIVTSFIHTAIYLFLDGTIKTVLLCLLYTLTFKFLLEMNLEKSLL